MEIKNLKDINNTLLRIEKKHNLFSIKILNKIPVWTYLRTNLVEHMYVKYNLTEAVAPKRNFTFLVLLNTFFSGFLSFYLFFKKRKSSIWFIETSRRINGKEPYCQPIYDELNKESYSKFCYSETWNYNNDVIYLNFVKLFIMFLSILLSPFLSFFITSPNYKTLQCAIKDIIGDNSYNFNQKYIECFLWYIFFNISFKINKPKKIFIVSNTFFIPLIAVCDKYSVETIEIQHGIMSKYTLNYNFPNLERKSFFPNKILLLGNSWSFMEKYFPKGVETLTLGSQNFNRKKNNLKTENKSVLIVSQKPIRDYLISFLNSNKSILCDFKIYFKLHPMEVSMKKEILNNIHNCLHANLNIIGNEKSVNELQNIVACQIGAYSTALVEGVQYDLPTLLVKTPLSDHLHFLKNTGIKTTPINKTDLILFLRSKHKNYNVEYFTGLKKQTIDEITSI